MSIASVTKKGRELQPLDHYLKPLRPRQGLGEDWGETASGWLDRKIAKQERAAARKPEK